MTAQEINQMYSRKNGLVIGFHGCDESVRDAITQMQDSKKKIIFK